MLGSLLARLARSSTRHPKAFLAAGLLLTLLAAAALPQLTLLSSRAAMNPKGLPEIQLYEEHLKDFGSSAKLIMILDGPPEVLGPFSDELAPTLLGPGSPVKSVHHKLDLDFFKARLFLFLPEPVLKDLVLYLETHRPALESLQQQGLPWLAANPMDLLPADATGLAEADPAPLLSSLGTFLEGRLRGSDTSPLRQQVLAMLGQRAGTDPQGHFRSRDGGLLFLFASPVNPDESQEAIRPFVEFCQRKTSELAASWRGRGLTPPTLGLAGLPAMVVEEADSLQADTVLTATAAAVAILLIVVFGFGSLRRGLVVFLPLVAAGLWNLGLTLLTVGHLNMLTSAFLAVLFGLGVDYGIFLTSRYLEERRPDQPLEEIAARALASAGRTVLAAGLTTALAFLVLLFNPYQGFSELGIVAGTGVLCVMVAYLTLLPALLALIPLGPEPRHRFRPLATFLPQRSFPVFSTITVVLALGLAVWSGLRGTDLPLDFDVRNLMPEDAQSTRYTREMTSRSDFQPEFVVSVAPSLEEARRRTAAFRALPTVARVDSPSDLMPPTSLSQEALLGRLARALPRPSPQPAPEATVLTFLDDLYDSVEGLQEQAFATRREALASSLEGLLATVEGLRSAAQQDPAIQQHFARLNSQFQDLLAEALQVARNSPTAAPTLAELPPMLRASFVGSSGRLAVMVYPKDSVYSPQFLDRFMAEVYTVDAQATGYPATHQVVSRLMFEGFLKATLLALAAVFLMLLLEFRNLRRTLSAFFPLLMGGVLMFGVMDLAGLALNFANIIALPLVLGLAVDYGVFLTHRLAERPTDSPFLVALGATRPLLLAALTTACSIGALTLGQHQGAASLGKVLIFGIATCLLSALVLLPALTTLLRHLRRPSPNPGVQP